METSTGITASSQDIRHDGTAENGARESIDRSFRRTANRSSSNRHGWGKKVVVIAALGLAGALSVTAWSSHLDPSPVPTHTTAPVAHNSPAPAAPTAQPSMPTDPDSSTGRSEDGTARNIANYIVSEPLDAGDGTTATDATCDPATVSDPSDVSTPTSVSCDITYSDGTVWQQTVTITYDEQGNPDDLQTNDGVELSPSANE
jgi:hypothetical protein